MLQPGFSVAGIAAKRNKSNPWFKCGTLLRSAVDVLRASSPMAPREIATVLIADKAEARRRDRD
jgi:hypothetical protein